MCDEIITIDDSSDEASLPSADSKDELLSNNATKELLDQPVTFGNHNLPTPSNQVLSSWICQLQDKVKSDKKLEPRHPRAQRKLRELFQPRRNRKQAKDKADDSLATLEGSLYPEMVYCNLITFKTSSVLSYLGMLNVPCTKSSNELPNTSPILMESPGISKYLNRCSYDIVSDPASGEVFLRMEGERKVAPIDVQPIPDGILKAAQLLGSFFRTSGRPGYSPKDGSGFWRKVVIRTNEAGHIMVVVYVARHTHPPEEVYLIKNELARLAIEASFASVYFAEEPSPPTHLVGATHIVERLGGLRYSIAPESTFPENTRAAEVLYQQIIEMSQMNSKSNVIVINCRSRALVLRLAEKGRRVYALDENPVALQEIQLNASDNEISNLVLLSSRYLDRELLKAAVMIDSYGPCNSSKKALVVLDCPADQSEKVRRWFRVLRNTDWIKRLIVVLEISLPSSAFSELIRQDEGEPCPFVAQKAIAVDLYPNLPNVSLCLSFQR